MIPLHSATLGTRDYMVYLITRAFGVLGTVAQSVTMGWQVYDLARAERGVAESALWVGILGLATFIPLFFLALPAGVVADRYSRRDLVMACFAAEALCSVAWRRCASPACGRVSSPGCGRWTGWRRR